MARRLIVQSSVKDRLALARSHVRRGEFPAAEAVFTALLKDCPDFADVHNEAGLFFHERGEFDKAQAEFRRALEINPAYTEAALHLSITWNDMGRYEDARKVYSDALQKSRGGRDILDPPLARRVANLHADIGDAYAQAGEWARAAQAYRDGLALCPDFHDVRLRLAQTLMDGGDASAATTELKRIIGACPDLTSARLLLGLAYLIAGDREKAEIAWRGVVEREPGHPRAAMYLRLLERR